MMFFSNQTAKTRGASISGPGSQVQDNKTSLHHLRNASSGSESSKMSG